MMEDGLVERLHGLLAGALARGRPDPFGSPVTVAEIYQDLVPYRTVRSALGFQMNADYEHTLLRMLAGEGGLARLEPAEARAELRTELDTPNPNVGLFRKFAACDVWITAAELPAHVTMQGSTVATRAPLDPLPTLPAVDWDGDVKWPSTSPSGKADGEWEELETELLLEEEVDAPDPSTQRAPKPAAEPRRPAAESRKPAAESRKPSAEPRTRSEAANMLETTSKASLADAVSTGACSFCRTGLPGGRMVRYCPFCGADQSLQPCPSCREPLEPSWKFCIACGARQS